MFAKRKIVWIVLIVLALGIKLFSLFPGAVEQVYSTGLYLFIARLQRILLGWIPFSVGDLFYAAIGLWLLAGLVSFIMRIVRRRVDKEYFFGVLRRIVVFSLLLYVLFYLLWGLNYSRRGIAAQLQLKVQPYQTVELKELLVGIVDKLNSLDSVSGERRHAPESKRALFAGSVQCYDLLAARDPRFAYPSPSVKPSLYSYLGNYLGFTGYYNPFSGEAQVNTAVPAFTRPYTTCHEIGHQLGYAKENEANFAGYLSARESRDPAFQYSVYFDLYLYAARELYVRDSSLVRPIKERLRPAVRKDFRELQQFFRKYENPFEPIIRRLYGRYLKANGQPQGIMTYNEVIAWILAYHKKSGMPF